MKAGIIGPSVLCEKFKSEIDKFPNLCATAFIYESVRQAPCLAHAAQAETDLLFFTGFAPYLASLDTVVRSIPWFSLGVPADGVPAALLRARNCFAGGVRFSLDSADEDDLDEICEEAGLEKSAISLYPYKYSGNLESDYLEFHLSTYSNGCADFCLTCLSTTYDELRRRGIPAFYVTPSRRSIRTLIETAIKPDVSREDLKTVCGLHTFTEPLDPEKSRKVREFVMEFLSRKGILYLPSADCSFGTVNTWGQFLVQTENFSRVPMLEAMEKKFPGLRLRSGYGLATTIVTAQEWASMALKISSSAVSDIVLFDGREYRRMGDGPVSHSYSARLARAAARLKISTTTLIRYMDSLRLVDTLFSAREFSNIVGIQPQASRKILSALQAAGVVRTAGKRPGVGKGRPETLYRLQKAGLRLTERRTTTLDNN